MKKNKIYVYEIIDPYIDVPEKRSEYLLYWRVWIINVKMENKKFKGEKVFFLDDFPFSLPLRHCEAPEIKVVSNLNFVLEALRPAIKCFDGGLWAGDRGSN